MANGNQITYSTELMVNFKQAEVISPQKKFQALQTNDGYSLLFSIGDDEILYLTEQTQGSSTGWEQLDLSSQLSTNYNGAKITAKTFAVAQNVSTNKIDMALAITVDSVDYLYLSLNNDSTNNSITSSTISWTLIPYDDPAHTGITLDIKNIYIAETRCQEYIVVDISKESFAEPTNFLQRYYIDMAKTNQTYWNPMDIGGDLDPNVASCLGRKANERVDGIYTLGSINGESELLYAQLYNPFIRQAPPIITRLQIPQGASSLVAIDNGNQYTDLFVAAQNSLIYFPADQQHNDATGIEILNNALFDGVSKLYAYSTDDVYTVWGLNRANQIFYTSCLKVNATNPNGWSYPVPILTGVDQVSPYINCVNQGHTFFAVAENELIRAEKSTQTSIWSFQNMLIKAPVNTKALQYSSYTTNIQLTDENDQLMANTTLYISANTTIPVYINHLYYVLNETPLPIATDKVGSINIVQGVQDIVGGQLVITDNCGATVSINPMDKAFNKITSLDSSDKLRNAKITSPNGTQTPLIDPNTSENDLQQVANANTSLSKAYSSVNKSSLYTPTTAMLATRPLQSSDIGSAIEADIGDMFQWLESGIDHAFQLIEDTATGVWNFVVTIGDAVYQGVLDCVEKVVGVVKWIYNVIKTAIEDLILFLEFLFEWKDITRTKEVIANFVKLYVQNDIAQIGVIKEKLDGEMQQLITTIDSWAKITDWSGLGSAATAPLNKSSNPSIGQGAPHNLLSSHFQNNSGNITQLNPPVTPNPSQTPIDTLFQSLKNEGVILKGFIQQMQQLSQEYKQMSLEDILKQVIGIIADGVLKSGQNVMDTLFDIFEEIANTVLQIFDTPVYVPVISDILEFFGVPSISFLDLFCWIAAVPLTIGYKLAHNSTAPFQDDAYSAYIINATSFDDLVTAFSGNNSNNKAQELYLRGNAMVGETGASGIINMSDGVKSAVHVIGHGTSGFFTLMSCFVTSFEAAEDNGDNEFAIPSAVLGVLAAATSGIASILVPKDPIENPIFNWVNRCTAGLAILAQIIFSGPAQEEFAAKEGVMNMLKVGDGRATGGVVDSVLVIPALICTCWHFYELSQISSNATKTTAILDEISKLTSYISRISYAVAVNAKDPDTKAVSIGIMIGANVATTGLQTAEAIEGA